MQRIIATTKPATARTKYFPLEDNFEHEPRAVDQTAIGEQYNFSVRQLMAFRARGKAFRIHKKVKLEEVEA